MSWFLASPGYQHTWLWSCRRGKLLFYSRKDFTFLVGRNYLSMLDVRRRFAKTIFHLNLVLDKMSSLAQLIGYYSLDPCETNHWNVIEIKQISRKKISLEMSSVKQQSFFLGCTVIIRSRGGEIGLTDWCRWLLQNGSLPVNMQIWRQLMKSCGPVW